MKRLRLAVIVLLLIGAVAVALLRFLPRAQTPSSSAGNSEALVSLVLLLRQPRQPTAFEVRAAAERAFHARFGTNPADNNFAGTFRDNMFPVRVHGSQLGVICSPQKYFDDGKAAEQFADPALRDAIKVHRGWISVDWFGPLDAKDRPEAYRLIGRLLAELTEDDCLAVYAPERGQLRKYDVQSKGLMRGSSPVDAFVDDVPVTVADDDPKMKAAEAEARRRWPEFVNAFGHRAESDHFSAKASFRDGENVEFMWVTVTKIGADSVQGTLDNEPSIVHNLTYGQLASFRLADLNDWLYKDPKGLHGGFTIAAVEAARGGSNAQKR